MILPDFRHGQKRVERWSRGGAGIQILAIPTLPTTADLAVLRAGRDQLLRVA
jgi:hypothetical protein